MPVPEPVAPARPVTAAEVVAETTAVAPAPPAEPTVAEEAQATEASVETPTAPREVEQPFADKAADRPVELAAAAPRRRRPRRTPRPRRQRGRSIDRRAALGSALVLLGALGLLCSFVLAVGALVAALQLGEAGAPGALSTLCDALIGPLGGLFRFSGTDGPAKAELLARGVGSMVYLALGLALPSLARRIASDD